MRGRSAGASARHPYKSRPGRTVESCKAAFRDLADRLEGVVELRLLGNSRWAEVTQTLAGATRPFHLAAIEDEIDAIFCAHLAWRWEHLPDSLTVYGSDSEGFIVAPPRPTWDPMPRTKGSAV